MTTVVAGAERGAMGDSPPRSRGDSLDLFVQWVADRLPLYLPTVRAVIGLMQTGELRTVGFLYDNLGDIVKRGDYARSTRSTYHSRVLRPLSGYLGSADRAQSRMTRERATWAPARPHTASPIAANKPTHPFPFDWNIRPASLQNEISEAIFMCSRWPLLQGRVLAVLCEFLRKPPMPIEPIAPPRPTWIGWPPPGHNADG